MKRTYDSNVVRDDVSTFVGIEVERTPCYGLKTYFVAGIPEDKPVVFRTLDVGADKAAPYMGFQDEDNPFLGYRAVRRQLKEKKVLKEQLWRFLMKY